MNFNPFIDLIITIFRLYSITLIIWIILSWLTAFNIVNRYNPLVRRVSEFLYKITEPPLSYIRRFIPPIGGIDIGGILLFILIEFVINILRTYFYHY